MIENGGMVWYAALKLRFRVFIPIYLLIIETRSTRYVLYTFSKIGFATVIETDLVHRRQGSA